MVHNLSAKFIDKLIFKKLIEVQDRDICCYGLEITLQKGISCFWIILLAAYFQILLTTILFLFFYYMEGCPGEPCKCRLDCGRACGKS